VKKTILVVALLLSSSLVFLALFPFGQKPDMAFNVAVPNPTYVANHPVVLFDEGHYNSHTVRSGYAPFAKLMESDGYAIRRHRGALTPQALRDVSILMIVNAAGGSNPKLFGINLVPLRKGQRDAPAFSDDEIQTVREWIENGGSLLLVADHHPFGQASAWLASALGVTMHGGFTEVSNQYPGQTDPSAIEFSRDNGLLGEHPITNGRTPDETIKRVRSFTGQSLEAPNAVVLLRLPPSAVDYVPPETEPRPSGSAQAVAFEYGRGRLVVLGEAGMLTAQVSDGRRFGMNIEGLDNRQFALSIMHWLSRNL